VLFLLVTTWYSWKTPVWEANDEPDHVDSVQILHDGRIPAVGDNVESGQPPLYYALTAVWQSGLGIPTMEVAPRPDSSSQAPGELDRYLFAHDYDSREHTQAIRVHLLRMFSVLLGAVTVWLSQAVARQLGGRRDLALAVGLTVALWPKFTVVSATVQNDSLAALLCSALIYVVLRWHADEESRRGRAALTAAMGLLSGAAALTKYTTLPVIGLLLLVCLVHSLLGDTRHRRRRVIEVVVAGLIGLMVSGWWFIRNVHLYGDVMANTATSNFLKERIPGLVVPVPWTDQQRFLEDLPRAMLDSTWYIGGWNQWSIPLGTSLFVTAVACASYGGAARVAAHLLTTRGWSFVSGRLLPVLAATSGGMIAVLVIAQATTQGQGRYLFTAISVIAFCLVVGMRELAAENRVLRVVGTWTWPAILAALNLYAALLYVVPNQTL
jgi:uncharacterized membrane protein